MDGDQVTCEVCGQPLPALYRTVNGRTLCVEADHPTPDTMFSTPPARVADGSRPPMKLGSPQLRGLQQQG